jgi:hypothetical protein
LKKSVSPNSTKKRPKEQFRKNRKRSDCLGLNAERETGPLLTTNNERRSNKKRFVVPTSDVRMVDVRENDAMLHSVKTKGDVTIVNMMKRDVAMIVGVRKTDDAPITTEGCAATKNKRSH